MSSRLVNWLAEARRRRVFRTAGLYLVAVWGVSQGAVDLAPLFGAPDWALRLALVVAVALLPVVLLLAWMFDVGRHGIVRDRKDVERRAKVGPGDADEIANMPTLLGGEAGHGGVLVGWEDPDGGGSALFTDEFVIGRGSECRVRFYDPLVSRRHARIAHDGEIWRIEDLGSRNGTIVDGEKVDAAILAPRSVLRINEAGPVLELRLIAPGAQLTAAREDHAGGTVVAHVRRPAADGRTRTAAGPRVATAERRSDRA